MMQRVLLAAKEISPAPGGIARYAEQVTKGYLRAGCQVTLITTNTPDADLMTQTSDQIIVGRRSQFLIGVVIFMRLLFKILVNGERWDVVHATTGRMALPLLLLRMSGIRVTVHGNEFLRRDLASRLFVRLVLSKAERITAVSGFTRNLLLERFQTIPSTKVQVAHLGVSLENPADKEAGGVALNLLSVCRQNTRKNVEAAIESAGIAASSGARFAYTLVGDGVKHQALQRQADRIEALDHTFLPFVDDELLLELYTKADVYLHPQLDRRSEGDVEGFGLSIVDAMACGCVVIAGDNAGPAEIVNDGKDGYLVNPQDVEQIATLLVSLAQDRELLRKISANAKLTSATFTWDKHVGAILEDSSPHHDTDSRSE